MTTRMGTLRPGLAGVAALLALVFAIGMGGAYAGSKIGSDDIARNAVLSKHLKNGQVKPVDTKGLVSGRSKLVAKSATAAQGGFLAQPIPLVKVPGMGQVELIYCGTAAQGNQIRVRLIAEDDAEPFFGSNVVSSSGLAVGTGKGEHVDHGGGTFASGGGEPYIAQAGGGGVDLGLAAKWDFTFWRNTGSPRVAHVTVSGLNGLVNGDKCDVSAQGEVYR